MRPYGLFATVCDESDYATDLGKGKGSCFSLSYYWLTTNVKETVPIGSTLVEDEVPIRWRPDKQKERGKGEVACIVRHKQDKKRKKKFRRTNER